jgi:hypothetical protein
MSTEMLVPPHPPIDLSGLILEPGRERFVVFEWPNGTQLVRYLTADSSNNAIFKTQGFRSTSIMLTESSIMLGLEDPASKQDPSYVPRMTITLDAKDPLNIEIYGVNVQPDIFLQKELLDAVRWLIVERFGVDENQLMTEQFWKDRNMQLRWALHFPEVVSDATLQAIRSSEATMKLDVAIRSWIDLQPKLRIMYNRKKAGLMSHSEKLAFAKARKHNVHYRQRIRHWLEKMLRELDRALKTTHHQPGSVLMADIALEWDFNDAALFFWKIGTNQQGYADSTSEQWAMYSSEYKPSADTARTLIWCPKLGKAVDVCKHAYRDGDLIDFLEHLGIVVPESRYEAWLDNHIASPSRSYVMDDGIFLALNVTLIWLRPMSDLNEFLKAIDADSRGVP